jgi:DNA-directed RNA polymerase subunit alpha
MQGPVIVTASHLELPSEIVLVDPRQYIATITQKVVFEIECRIENGCGYNLVEQSSSTDFFNIDAVYMPVRKIGIQVEEVLLGQEQQTESLILEITTNGSIKPRRAIEEGAKILISLLTPLQAFPETNVQTESTDKEVDYKRILIEELQLSVRAYNCLKRAKIHTMADLLVYSQKDLLEIKNFGLKSVNEVVTALEKRLGITLPKKAKKEEG